MKTITALLIGGSLALAGAVMAQEPTPQESQGKKGGKGQKAEQTQTTGAAGGNATGNAAGNAKSNRNAASTETAAPGTETGGGKQRGGKHAKTEMGTTATGAESATGAGANTNVNATTETGGRKGKHGRNATAETATEAGASVAPGANQPVGTGGRKGKGRNATVNTGAEAGASVAPGASQPAMDQGGKKGRKARAAAAAAASASAAPSASVGTNATNATSTTNATTSAPPTTSATVGAAAATTNTTTATGGNPTANTGTTATLTKEQGTVGRGGKKVEVQQLQQIKQQHATFRAQPRPDRVPAVTFNQNYRISGAERWQGPQYEVYRSYHPEWHDQGWYRSRYQRVENIGGGWYYWNNGYWYPAWGYEPSASYYAYDAPIYVGHRAEPPDRVIADVQAELQQMGYYTGEVDGLLGPLTRQALRDYQADHGLMVTEVIDEPTLNALQLS